MNTYELFQKIKERPEMYLGRCSIYDLKAFHDGYLLDEYIQRDKDLKNEGAK